MDQPDWEEITILAMRRIKELANALQEVVRCYDRQVVMQETVEKARKLVGSGTEDMH